MEPLVIIGKISSCVATVNVGGATVERKVDNEWEVYALMWLALLEGEEYETPHEYRASLNARLHECAAELWSKSEVYKLIMPEQQ